MNLPCFLVLPCKFCHCNYRKRFFFQIAIMADQIPKSSSNHTIDGALIGLSHVFYLPGTSKCFFIDLLTKSNSASAQKIKRSYTSADKISHTKRLTILARIENLHSSIKNIQANKNTKNFWETHKWYNFHRTLLIYQP